MIRKKIIRVPIYQAKVTVLLVDSLKEIEDRYQLKDTECVAAMVFRRKYNYFVAFERLDPGIIAHEVTHLVNHIFYDRGVELDLVNDEPQAYLTGWLYGNIYDIIYKKFNYGQTKISNRMF